MQSYLLKLLLWTTRFFKEKLENLLIFHDEPNVGLTVTL